MKHDATDSEENLEDIKDGPKHGQLSFDFVRAGERT